MVDPGPSRADARAVAEHAREGKATRPSFAAELFLGRVRAGPRAAVPRGGPARTGARASRSSRGSARCWRGEMDPTGSTREGRLPERALRGSTRGIGAFRMRLPPETVVSGSRRRLTAARWRWPERVRQHGDLALGDQSIGVPTPLGVRTEAQKARWLPGAWPRGRSRRSPYGAPEAGSDPRA